MPKTAVARDVASEDPACNFGLLARLFGIAKSSLWHRSEMDEKDFRAKAELETVHAEHPWYGYRRIGWTLGWGFPKTRRLMKKFGVAAVVKKAKRRTKTDDVGQPDAGIPNLAKEVPADRPDRVWRTDFTFLVWRGMPFYLATVLDAYSREIAGYSIGLRHNAEFVLEAVRDAIRKTGKKPGILHSDQGSEYRSFVALGFLAENGILPSMSAKASPWQNGQQESYYGKFKLETRNLSSKKLSKPSTTGFSTTTGNGCTRP